MYSLNWSSESTEILLGSVCLKMQALGHCGLHYEKDVQGTFRSSHLTAYLRVGAGAIVCAASRAGETVNGIRHQGQDP